MAFYLNIKTNRVFTTLTCNDDSNFTKKFLNKSTSSRLKCKVLSVRLSILPTLC